MKHATGPLTTGSTFHNWKLERVLAQGSGGTVYLAKHRLVRRQAAIKVLSPPRGATADPKAIDRFYVEVELSVSLRLPNLPDFYDAELMPDGTAVLVLEHLEGIALDRLLATRGRLAIADALFVTAEVLGTLQVLHESSIHRDIKPSNLFIRRRPRLDSAGRVEKRRVVVLDFGLAKITARAAMTKHLMVVGTHCYMSPEQLRGEALDARSDLYALGVVLYELLRGTPPFFDAPNAPPLYADLVRKHLDEPPRDLRLDRPELSAEVCRFVDTLLAKNRRNRFASAADALEAARSLCARHVTDANIFRSELAEEHPEAAPIEPAPLTQRMSAPPSFAPDPTEDEAPATGAEPSSHGTERLRPEGEPLDPWEERQLAHVRAALRAPRIFRAPAIARLDARAQVLQPLQHAGPAITSTFRVRPDGTLSRAPLAPSSRALVIHEATTAAGQIVHGTSFAFAGVDLQLVDRAVVDPAPGSTVRRTLPPLLVHVSRATNTLRSFIVLNVPLAIVGSLPACDLVIPGAPAICAAVWLRGDGQLELAQLDESQLPYGQPVTACRLLADGEVVDLGGDVALRIQERSG